MLLCPIYSIVIKIIYISIALLRDDIKYINFIFIIYAFHILSKYRLTVVTERLQNTFYMNCRCMHCNGYMIDTGLESLFPGANDYYYTQSIHSTRALNSLPFGIYWRKLLDFDAKA